MITKQVRVRHKQLSSDSGILYAACNIDGVRNYKCCLFLNNNDLVIESECEIKDYFKEDMDRSQWALLLSELRKELKDDL